MKRLTLITLILLAFTAPCWAGNVILAWQPNSEPDLAGYRMFERIEGQTYDYANPVWQGGEISYVRADPTPGETYYWVVRAFDIAGNESGDSNEVSKTIPVPDTIPPGVPTLNVPIYIQIGQ